MRIIVCGSRSFQDYSLLQAALDTYNDVSLIEGGAAGADTMALEYALWRGWDWQEYPADWGRYGRAAGPIRNRQMLVEGKPDLVLAFFAVPYEQSKGTRNMVEQAKEVGIPSRAFHESSPL